MKTKARLNEINHQLMIIKLEIKRWEEVLDMLENLSKNYDKTNF